MRTLMNCFWKVRYENLNELFFGESGMRTLVNCFWRVRYENLGELSSMRNLLVSGEVHNAVIVLVIKYDVV